MALLDQHSQQHAIAIAIAAPQHNASGMLH